MVRQLKLQDRLIAMTAIPIVVVAVVAAGLLLFLDAGGTTSFGVFAVVGLVVSVAAALILGASIRTSIAELTSSADGLVEAHRRLAAGEITAADLPQLPVEGDDELSKLSASINAINAITAEAGETRRSEVKEGLSNIVVNLARRSQTLLDRQVEYLDRLEGSEEDPDRLSELFKVDHLATRMRRNAESLKVLAEADPGRRRGGPVEVADVLRVAMGEVENYESIELNEIAAGQVDSGTAMDLAHMVAELMENATQFSPPDKPVEVSGVFDTNDRFVITIQDHGMGMPKQKLLEANTVLADPPELGLGMGRSLGFMVVGRLAIRLGATVQLALNGASGTRAVVSVPANVFTGQSDTAPTQTLAVEKTPEVIEETPSGSPALEKLLGLTQANLEKGDADTVGDAPDEPADDWAANSPFAGAQPSQSAALPVRDETTQAKSDQAETDQVKSDQANSDQAEPESVSAETEADEPEKNVAGSTQTRSTRAKGKRARRKARAAAKHAVKADQDDTQGKAETESETKRTDSVTADGTKTGPTKSDATKSDATKADSEKSDVGTTDPAKIDPPKADVGEPDREKSDVGVSDVDTSASDDADPAESLADHDTEQDNTTDGDAPSDEGASWTPPEVTADAPPRAIEAPEKLVDAIPTGQAFDNGVDSLLNSDRADNTAGLTKRQRGASQVPIGQGRPIAASRRDPEEIKSMLSRYRDGLKGGRQLDQEESADENKADSDDESKDGSST